MEKEGLYTEIQAYIEGLSGSDAKTKMENIIVKLKEGKKIQDSSANIMCFQIQNFMDYGQIKAGKFKQNFGAFNIREAIE